MLECPEATCWTALLSATLPLDRREECERHLESCAVCQKHLEDAVDDSDRLLYVARRVGDPTLLPADPELSHIMGRLQEVKSPMHTRSADPADLFFLDPATRPNLL